MANITMVQQFFDTGMVGNRLDGIRNSELYTRSAKVIDNMLITDIGSLRVARKFNEKDLNLDGKYIEVLSTIFSYYVILTTQKVYLMNKSDNTPKGSFTHGYGDTVRIAVIANNQFVMYTQDGTKEYKTYNLTEGGLQEDTEYLNVNLPIRDKEVVSIDIWKISKNPTTGTGIPKTIATPLLSGERELKLTIKNGEIFLYNSNTKIDRVYTVYRANVDAEDFKDSAEGKIYAVIRVNHKPSAELSTTWIIDNKSVEFGALTNDAVYGGDYFTTFANNVNVEGIFTFGNLVDIRKPTCMAYFQNRLFACFEGYIYASVVNKIKDFRNDTGATDGFFFRPNPINNKTGDIIHMVSDYGLYIISSVGIYSLGYGGNVLTPNTFGGEFSIASNQNVSRSCCPIILNGILYFNNYNNILKALIVDRTSQTLQFDTVTVDRYNTKVVFDYFSSISIEDKDYLITRSKDDTYIYLISYQGEGLFSNTRLSIPTTSEYFLCFEDKILNNNKIYAYGVNNYDVATVTINTPNFITEDAVLKGFGDIYSYDEKSIIKEIMLKFVNEDRQGIKSVKALGKNIGNLSPDQDLFNIYRAKTDTFVKKGLDIVITTNGNDKAIELLGYTIIAQPVKSL